MLDEQSRLEAQTPYLYSFNQHALPVTDIACFLGAIAVSSSEDRTCKVRKRLYWLELNAMKDCSLFLPISNYSMYIIYLVTSGLFVPNFIFFSPDLEFI